MSGVADLQCQHQPDLLFRYQNTEQPLSLCVLFLGGVHLAMASVYLGNIAVLLEVSPMLACP